MSKPKYKNCEYYECENNRVDPCTVGVDKLVVSPKGYIIPCESFKFLLHIDYDDIRPNVKDYSIDFIFKNDPLFRLLKCDLNPLDNWCKNNCRHYQCCGGGCKGQKALKVKDKFISFLKKEMKRFYKKYPKGK